MVKTKLPSGATKVIKLKRAPVRVMEIKFNWSGSNAIQLQNHIVPPSVTTPEIVKTPEWKYDISRRLLKLKKPILKGDDVKKVQQELLRLGFNVGPQRDDGKFGKDTEKVVKQFQKKHGLKLNGIVGPETRTFLGSQGGIAYIKNTQFIIQVKFKAPNWINSAEIWAVDGRDGFERLGSETDPSKPVKVNFSGGESGFYNFKIKTQPAKISLNKTRWLWRCRNINGKTSKVKDMGRSEHIIYVVCDTPQDPMAKPWIAVLHKACEWAKNEDTLEGAAYKVTKNINNTTMFAYDVVQGRSAYSTSPLLPITGIFRCAKYLERLHGGIGMGVAVNCTDCACMVTTFANALGCKLFESRMGDGVTGFRCNEISPIGFPGNWQIPFGRGFSYHEVAWIGACDNADPLFDACLKVDGDANPTAVPHTDLLPTNITFHVTGQTHYKERLAADKPDGRPNCNPETGKKRRRRVI